MKKTRIFIKRQHTNKNRNKMNTNKIKITKNENMK